MTMYEKELRGEKYSKAEHRRNLLPKLNARSDGSVEFKHQNISAVLIDSGYPYIRGYKPAINYQSLLKDVVGSYLNVHEKQVIAQAERFIESDGERSEAINWHKVVTDAPDRLPKSGEYHTREFTPKKFNYSEREAQNKRLGISGEEFVLNYERYRLIQQGREDLAKEIEWTSQAQGDGAGYDIRSFNEKKDEELFIEVKTTNSGKFQPFFISDNEVAFSEINAQRYALYRVFEFRSLPKLFMLPGDVAENVHLQAKAYRASF